MTKTRIYADNAATTALNPKALEAMLPYLTNDYGNPSSAYSFSRKAKQAIKESRAKIAYLIGAEPHQIFFTSGGSESNNWVVRGTLGHRIITTPIEHHSLLRAAGSCKDVEYLPVSTTGMVSIDALAELGVSESLASVMMANNEIGTIQPIAELVAVAHKHRMLFHTDAVQAIGHIPIDVTALAVDYLSASAHKFNGPKGVGFLYIRDVKTVSPLIFGGQQENGMRGGTENVAGIVGMCVALEEAVTEMDHITKRLHILTQTVIEKLNRDNIQYARNGDNQLPGHLSLSFRGISGEALMHQLDLRGICVSTGSACDSQNTQISHVLKSIRLAEELALGTIRITFGRNNKLSDAGAIAQSLISILKQSN